MPKVQLELDERDFAITVGALKIAERLRQKDAWETGKYDELTTKNVLQELWNQETEDYGRPAVLFEAASVGEISRTIGNVIQQARISIRKQHYATPISRQDLTKFVTEIVEEALKRQASEIRNAQL
jgi:hypothetical protein